MVIKYVQEAQDPMAWLGFDMISKNDGQLHGLRLTVMHG